MDAFKQMALSLGTIAVCAAAFWLLRDHAQGVAISIGVGALVVPILWLLVSSLRPAMPDRKCPKCGQESLRLFERGKREGVRCPACGFQDAEMYVAYLIDVDDALDEPVK
jgi:hypothetical protein